MLLVAVAFVRAFGADAVFFARGARRIDMHDRSREKRQMRHELSMHFRGDRVPLFDAERRIDGDVHFCE